MSKNSEAVKNWRKRCKEKIIISMGGKCCICNYNKCSAALALHHLDPNQKDFSFGKIRANPVSWTKIVKELKKCVLVCHNEIHSGMIEVPCSAPRFNEQFSNYKYLLNSLKETLTPCIVCNKLKPSHLKTCSRKCSSNFRPKIDWDNIDLAKEIKIKAIIKIAEELGCSDGGVHKRLKKLGLKQNKNK